MYTASSIVDLEERCLNEWWLLEEVYSFAEDKLTSTDDALVYPPEGGALRHYGLAAGSIHIGDWRPGFRTAAPHVIFINAFKVLDALVEWTLTENSRSVGYKFSDKIEALKDTSLVFAPFVQSRPWLKERVIRMYREIEPLRSMIVHGRHFTSSQGTLQVARTASDPNMVTVSEADLRNLSLIVVALIRYIGETWTIDPFLERRLRRALDEIRELHHAPLLGQRVPMQLNARQYLLRSDPIEVDLDQLRVDVETRTPKKDAVYHLRLVVVDEGGTTCETFLVPFDELVGTKLVRSLEEMRQRFTTTTLPDTDAASIARALVARA